MTKPGLKPYSFSTICVHPLDGLFPLESSSALRELKARDLRVRYPSELNALLEDQDVRGQLEPVGLRDLDVDRDFALALDRVRPATPGAGFFVVPELAKHFDADGFRPALAASR